MTIRFPYEIRNVPPHAACVRLPERDNGTGLPDGVHSGGCWIDEEANEVWKPMLNLVNLASGPYFIASKELAFFQAMHQHHVALCPKNYRIERTDDERVWMVRQKAYDLRDWTHLDLEQRTEYGLAVEEGVAHINRLGWSLGDTTLGVLIDPDSYDPFIVDGSCAYECGLNAVGCYRANDTDALHRWWKSIGLDGLVDLRIAGSSILLDRYQTYDIRGWEEFHRSPFKHVYLSYNRPFTFAWADKYDEGERIIGQTLNKKDVQREGKWTVYGHTWIVTAKPLSEQYQARYELRHAYTARD